MQVAGINNNYKSPFGNGFYNTTRELDSSVMLSRALVDGCGCTIPWILMANNETERKEKARKFLFENGFEIQNDIIVKDKKHYYVIMDADYMGSDRKEAHV